MKLAIILFAALITVCSCASSKSKCDAYSCIEDYDIHEINAKTTQKYESTIILK